MKPSQLYVKLFNSCLTSIVLSFFVGHTANADSLISSVFGTSRVQQASRDPQGFDGTSTSAGGGDCFSRAREFTTEALQELKSGAFDGVIPLPDHLSGRKLSDVLSGIKGVQGVKNSVNSSHDQIMILNSINNDSGNEFTNNPGGKLIQPHVSFCTNYQNLNPGTDNFRLSKVETMVTLTHEILESTLNVDDNYNLLSSTLQTNSQTNLTIKDFVRYYYNYKYMASADLNEIKNVDIKIDVSWKRPDGSTKEYQDNSMKTKNLLSTSVFQWSCLYNYLNPIPFICQTDDESIKQNALDLKVCKLIPYKFIMNLPEYPDTSNFKLFEGSITFTERKNGYDIFVPDPSNYALSFIDILNIANSSKMDFSKLKLVFIKPISEQSIFVEKKYPKSIYQMYKEDKGKEFTVDEKTIVTENFSNFVIMSAINLNDLKVNSDLLGERTVSTNKFQMKLLPTLQSANLNLELIAKSLYPQMDNTNSAFTIKQILPLVNNLALFERQPGWFTNSNVQNIFTEQLSGSEKVKYKKIIEGEYSLKSLTGLLKKSALLTAPFDKQLELLSTDDLDAKNEMIDNLK